MRKKQDKEQDLRNSAAIRGISVETLKRIIAGELDPITLKPTK